MIGLDDFRRVALTSNTINAGDGMERLAFLGFERHAVEEMVESFLAVVAQSGCDVKAAIAAAYTSGLEMGYRIGSEPKP